MYEIIVLQPIPSELLKNEENFANFIIAVKVTSRDLLSHNYV
jgi:hypothetical protein